MRHCCTLSCGIWACTTVSVTLIKVGFWLEVQFQLWHHHQKPPQFQWLWSKRDFDSRCHVHYSDYGGVLTLGTSNTSRWWFSRLAGAGHSALCSCSVSWFFSGFLGGCVWWLHPNHSSYQWAGFFCRPHTRSWRECEKVSSVGQPGFTLFLMSWFCFAACGFWKLTAFLILNILNLLSTFFWGDGVGGGG